MDSEINFSDGPADSYAEGEQPIVFHHKDGEFRKYEPKVYSDLATGKSAPKRGLFRVLVSTKMNRMIFIAMVVMFAVVILISLFGKKSHEDTVGGVFCSLSAFSFDDSVFVSMDMSRSTGSRFRDGIGRMDVNVEFWAVDADGNDFERKEKKFEFTDSGKKETGRITFSNYEITKIRAKVDCGGESVELSCKVVAK